MGRIFIALLSLSLLVPASASACAMLVVETPKKVVPAAQEENHGVVKADEVEDADADAEVADAEVEADAQGDVAAGEDGEEAEETEEATVAANGSRLEAAMAELDALAE